MHIFRQLGWPLAGALVCTSLPGPANACSALLCGGNIHIALPARVPANLGELTVHGDTEFPSSEGYALRLWEAGHPEQVLFSGQVPVGSPVPYTALNVPLGPGKRYVVEASVSCSHERLPESLEFEVGPASTLPTSLGPVRVVEQGRSLVEIGGGSLCFQKYHAGVVDVALDPAALPAAWRDVLTQYQLMVDGQPFSWQRSIAGNARLDAPRAAYYAQPGVFRAFTMCEEQPAPDSGDPWQSQRESPPPMAGLPAGKHTLWVRARVPSSEPTYIESERIEVELSCPQPSEAESGTPVDAGDAADDDIREASPADPPRDGTGGQPVDGDAGARGGADDGCSASPGRASSSNWGALLLSLGLFVAGRARARRRA